jgi:8-oxo-dGTP pyrophosphatase MutT (NUDIX family)
VTPARRPGPRIVLVGFEGGERVVEAVLGHGDDPHDLLHARGWAVERPLGTESVMGTEHVLTVRFAVRRGPAATGPVGGVATRHDEGLVLAPGERPEPYQRVAAYAVVTGARGLLLTQLSDRTNAAGQWGLPGGGIDPGEDPLDAVRRECWEESGQHVQVTDLAMVQTSHWIGRAPGGRVEDFHAVRIVYRATCAAPTDPVVHDVGGTTADARWVDPAEAGALPLTPGWRAVLVALSLLPDHETS